MDIDEDVETSKNGRVWGFVSKVNTDTFSQGGTTRWETEVSYREYSVDSKYYIFFLYNLRK